MLTAKDKARAEATDPRNFEVEGNPAIRLKERYVEYEFSEFKWFTPSQVISGKSETAACSPNSWPAALSTKICC